MKTSLLLFVLVCFAALNVNAQKQKIKVKAGVANVDGVDYMRIEKNSGSADWSILTMGSEEEIVYVQYMKYQDPSKVTRSNPNGNVSWYVLKFLTLDIECEVGSMSKKALTKLFLENDIITNDELNKEAAELLVKKSGTKWSDNRPGTTIIINN